jgi:predicted nucleic acid-binding protein
MARTDPLSAVSDAGPIIHLDELACLDLFQDFAQILITRQVWSEVLRHRPRLTTADIPGGVFLNVRQAPGPRLLPLVGSLRLYAGEIASLVLMQERPDHVFLCDDAAARLAAESLGFRVHGTIGVLVRSIRAGTRTREQVLRLLRDLQHRSSLHVSTNLLATVISIVEQERGE